MVTVGGFLMAGLAANKGDAAALVRGDEVGNHLVHAMIIVYRDAREPLQYDAGRRHRAWAEFLQKSAGLLGGQPGVQAAHHNQAIHRISIDHAVDDVSLRFKSDGRIDQASRVTNEVHPCPPSGSWQPHPPQPKWRGYSGQSGRWLREQ